MNNRQLLMLSGAGGTEKDGYRKSIHLFECLTYIKDEFNLLIHLFEQLADEKD